jgi:hypothetical protein
VSADLDNLDELEESDFESDVLSREDIRRYIVAGLSIGDLSAAFRISRFIMTSAIGTLQPVGRRHRSPIYAIADVAPLVVKPTVEVESYIKGLKPKDLPPSLQKAFWDAQEARQSYEEKAGNLWHTHRVQAVVGKLVMIVRQRLVLAPDQIDRLAPLSEEQRKLVQSTFDQALTELQQSVIDEFKDYDGAGDRQDDEHFT